MAGGIIRKDHYMTVASIWVCQGRVGRDKGREVKEISHPIWVQREQ